MPLFESRSIVVEKDADGSIFLKLDVPDHSLNVITSGMLADFEGALHRLELERNIPVLVVRSGKQSGFLAGADLHEFQSIQTNAQAEAVAGRGQRVFNRLAALPAPSLAVVGGPCLGGGLELALACDYRLVYDRPSTQLGLPEVFLGLLPAWGGTQRLPRIVGLERALQIILAGKRLGAREALRWGLADAVAGSETELRQQFAALTALAVQRGKRSRRWLPLRTWRQRFLESHPLGRGGLLRGAERLVRRRTPDDMPAPLEALEAVRLGLQHGVEAGLAQEREAVGRLALGPASRNLIGQFLRGEAARKLPANLEALEPAKVHRVGVVGAGVMGAGIAQLAAIKGCTVVVQEVNETALGAGLLRIQQLFAQAVERGLLTQAEALRRLGQVKGTLTWEGFREVEVVVEAVVEDPEVKRLLFRELEAHTRNRIVLASNTSALSLATMQQGLSQPERVAGLHFFNPVHKLPLVEVARTAATSDAAVALLTRWAIDLGKTPVQVKDSPGLVVNRVLAPYLGEAVTLVAEGLKIGQIDALLKRFGMPVGPLALLDEIGLDVAAQVTRALQPFLAERFELSTALEEMRNNGWLGTKNGRGFYDHKGKKAKENRLAENLVRRDQPPALTAALPLAARLGEARERMVLLMVNEAALVLSEGLAADADTIDLALVLGAGWAAHRGGPLRYGQQRGWPEVVRALDELTQRYGRRFQPCEELRRRGAAPVS
jgi:3-hydroxyacyl-CoA dehydrogenase/enoyl-CoA hydratase/3-hydroxybutyryl-CoA epimerase